MDAPKLTINIVAGPRKGERLELSVPAPGEPGLVIGRNRDCTIWVDSGDISRRHAEIYTGTGGELLVRDLGSINGTLVNGQPATQNAPYPLQPGYHILTGLSEFIFEGTTQPNVLPPTHRVDGGYIYIFLRDGGRFLFEGEELTVGRGQANEIVIDNPSISRQHARLTRTPNGIFVSDLGSTNKTFVNGVRADGPFLLRDGDLLRFGDIEAEFKIEARRLSGFFNSNTSPSELDLRTTNYDFDPAGSKTFMGDLSQDTIIDALDHNLTPAQRKSIEDGETNLNLELVIVGRNQRRAVAALPDSPTPPGQAYQSTDRATPTPQRYGPEVARIEGVYYTEGTGRAATLMLNNVTLGLRQGELVSLVGPSGSGKGILLQILAGILPADKGRITVLNYGIPTQESYIGRKKLNLEEDRDHQRWRHRTIGYLSDDPNMALNPRLTALEQITSALEQSGLVPDSRQRNDIALERLRLVGLNDPEVPRLKPSDLTRREKQLVSLARALANDPPLVLANEPMGNLHSGEANNVFALLQQLAANGKTVFIATQDQYWARNASRQIEILDGQIVGGLS